MAKAFPRLSLLVEEDPLPHLTASNGIAVLPSSASHGAFVAVAAHGVTSAASVAGTFDLGRPRTSSCPPIFTLHVYTLGTSSVQATGAASNATPQAPEMMLVHTIPILHDDVRCTHSLSTAQHGMVSKAAGGSQCTAPASGSAETVTLAETAWTGALFFSPRSTETVSPTAPSPSEVQQIAWVGLTVLAVMTRQRQLLLVRSGLAENVSSSSSEGEADAQFAAREEPHGSNQDASAVCALFARVEDFCAVTISDKSASGGEGSSSASVIIVAGLTCVSGVVCCDVAANTTQKVASLQPPQATPPPLLKEHKWNIGPFNHVAATALADSKVCICATSLSGSVEVYTWAVSHAGRGAVPVCVHRVLMAPGHFFYGIAVSAVAVSGHETTKQATQGISFWVVGGESTVTRSGRTALSDDAAASASSLPALRGPDGCVLEVSQTTQCPGRHQRDKVWHETTSTVNAAPRTWNSLWVSLSNGSPPTADVVARHAAVPRAAESVPSENALSAYEVVSCLRLRAPYFLQTPRIDVSAEDANSACCMPGCALASRYVLLVHTSAKRASGTDDASLSTSTSSSRCADNQEVRWSSAVLSLGNAADAGALDWLAAASSKAGTPPLFSIASVAPAHMAAGEHRDLGTILSQDVHDLILFTPHRLLQLRVSHRCDSAGERLDRLEINVQGTYDVDQPQRIVGVAPLLSPKAPAPLLIFYGSASQIVANGDVDGEDRRSLYGQPMRKPTWAMIADVRASLLRRLTTWSSLATAEAMPQRSSDAHTHRRETELLEAVQAMVEAEGARLRRHVDDRMDRLEVMLQRLLPP
ncbi:hypothetical protein LSCM4_01061 [Leishmania orientalis]|uniref:Uncharacterized protein n=1 Tax=Leishmania orientalis TaxID=2249476 RepID=A0A836K984_9TRYP|nr:hypothetical protein LSCM4_01061 [Leishmania orientalis]